MVFYPTTSLLRSSKVPQSLHLHTPRNGLFSTLAGARGAHLVNEHMHIGLVVKVQGGGRLIQHDELRPRNDDACKREGLLLAEAEAFRERLAGRVEARIAVDEVAVVDAVQRVPDVAVCDFTARVRVDDVLAQGAGHEEWALREEERVACGMSLDDAGPTVPHAVKRQA